MYYPALFVKIPTTVLSLPGGSEKATSLRWDCTNCNELSNQVLCSLGIVKPGTVFTIVKPGIVFTRYCQTRYCVHWVLSNQVLCSLCFVLFSNQVMFSLGIVKPGLCYLAIIKPDIVFIRYCQTRYLFHSVLSNQVLCSLRCCQIRYCVHSVLSV